VVIFGASGDLTYRKLIPALYNIAADGDLPASLTVTGFARREKTDESFRKELEEAARKYSRQSVDDEMWSSFSERLFYHRSEFGDSDGRAETGSSICPWPPASSRAFWKSSRKPD